jgi:hypothetical protein
VWRIRLDTTTNRLAMEVRDADVLLAYFYTFDAQLRDLKRLTLPQGQAWWQGLEDAQDGYIYLHGYGDRKLGQHKGIAAIAAASDTQVWEKAELAFYGLAADGLLAYPAATPEADFQLLEMSTGRALKAGISQQQAAEAVEQYSRSRNHKAIYPGVYLEGEDFYADVREFLETQLDAKPVQAIEYAETETALVTGYYERDSDSLLTNHIAVFDLEGHLLLKEKLADGLSGIGSDTFFIFMDDLYFIRDKAILEVYRLLA